MAKVKEKGLGESEPGVISVVSFPLIHGKMIAVMRDIGTIGKDQINKMQNYKYRGVDDVYASIKPDMDKHGIYMKAKVLSEKSEERTSGKGGLLIYRILHMRYYFIAEDGSREWTESIGEAMDSGDKASNKAMSVAQKYAIIQAFCIPTSDPKDPEIDSPNPLPKAKENAKRQVDLFDPANKSHKKLILDNIIENIGTDLSKELKTEFGSDIVKLMNRRPLTELKEVCAKYLQQKIMEE